MLKSIDRHTSKKLCSFLFIMILLSQLSGSAFAQPVNLSGQIVFVSDRDIDDMLYIIDLSSNLVTSITSADQDSFFPACSVVRQEIIFANTAFGPALYRIRSNGSDLTQLIQSNGSLGSPDISFDGNAMAFVGDSGTRIWTSNVDGSNARRVSGSTLDIAPSWSPDGTRITFTSYRDGNEEIYVMNTDGSNQIRLTSNTFSDRAPTWSPDGSTIAFSSDRTGSSLIYLMNIDGTNVRSLTNSLPLGSISSDPAWSPNGTRLAFSAILPGEGQWDIYVVNADGTNLQRIIDSPARDSDPCWLSEMSPIPSPTATTTSAASPTPTPTATGTLEATPTATLPPATATPTATAMGTLPPTGSTFYRAVNLGGPALMIGGNGWEANETTTGFILRNPVLGGLEVWRVGG